MSSARRHTIRCPSCGRDFSVELFDSLNRKDRADARELVMANRLNQVTCEGCGASFRVDKPLIYTDPGRGILIVWVPVPDEARAAGESQFAEILHRADRLVPEGVEAPPVHLVFSRTEMVERIFLLEAGLDARIIEYIKYTMYARNPARLDPHTKALLFNAEDSTDELLCFVVQDVRTRQFEAVLQYRRDAYQALVEAFRDPEDQHVVRLAELFPGPHISARRLLMEEKGDDTPPAGDVPAP
jgi:hypothetical protein